jgi:hypothetical protein
MLVTQGDRFGGACVYRQKYRHINETVKRRQETMTSSISTSVCLVQQARVVDEHL